MLTASCTEGDILDYIPCGQVGRVGRRCQLWVVPHFSWEGRRTIDGEAAVEANSSLQRQKIMQWSWGLARPSPSLD